MSGLRVAVVGATGLVGREILALLAERRFPFAELLPFASERSDGEEVEIGDDLVRVRRLPRELPAADVVFLCATPAVSREIADDLVAEGSLVIDLTGAWDHESTVPRAWAGRPLPGSAGGLLVATPGPLALLLASLLRPAVPFGLRRVVATALVSASVRGSEGVGALARASAALLGGLSPDEEGDAEALGRAFNAVLAPGELPGGNERVVREVRDVLEDSDELRLHLHVVRSPTFHGQGVALSVETAAAVSVSRLETAFRDAPSLVLGDAVGTRDAVGTDAVHVSGPRVDQADGTWFHLWATSDNLRQGAALNAVAVAESRLSNRPGRG